MAKLRPQTTAHEHRSTWLQTEQPPTLYCPNWKEDCTASYRVDYL
jgi:hypothetical protein